MDNKVKINIYIAIFLTFIGSFLLSSLTNSNIPFDTSQKANEQDQTTQQEEEHKREKVLEVAEKFIKAKNYSKVIELARFQANSDNYLLALDLLKKVPDSYQSTTDILIQKYSVNVDQQLENNERYNLSKSIEANPKNFLKIVNSGIFSKNEQGSLLLYIRVHYNSPLKSITKVQAGGDYEVTNDGTIRIQRVGFILIDAGKEIKSEFFCPQLIATHRCYVAPQEDLEISANIGIHPDNIQLKSTYIITADLGYPFWCKVFNNKNLYKWHNPTYSYHECKQLK